VGVGVVGVDVGVLDTVPVTLAVGLGVAVCVAVRVGMLVTCCATLTCNGSVLMLATTSTDRTHSNASRRSLATRVPSFAQSV